MALILIEKEIQKAISMREAIDAVRKAYIHYANGEARVPPRTTIEVPETNDIAMMLPSYLPKMAVIGLKTVSVFFDNSRQGLPLVSALIILQDGRCQAALPAWPSNLSIRTAQTFVSGILATGSRAEFVRTFVGLSAKWKVMETIPG
jgi:ornithine cyclodeaminase/alanine dehydrogenase-like protein (mu-crystallin family)